MGGKDTYYVYYNIIIRFSEYLLKEIKESGQYEEDKIKPLASLWDPGMI